MAAINFDKLTMDEVEQIEELSGMRMDQLMVPGQVPSAKAIKAVTLVALHRTDPTATLDQVAAMTYLECINLITDDDEDDADPKAATVKRATTKKNAPT